MGDGIGMNAAVSNLFQPPLIISTCHPRPNQSADMPNLQLLFNYQQAEGTICPAILAAGKGVGSVDCSRAALLMSGHDVTMTSPAPVGTGQHT